MAKNISIDISQPLALLKNLGRKVAPSVINLALARAINRVTASGKTAASREIRRKYRIKKRDLDKNMSTPKASRVKPVGSIFTWGKPISLNYFSPKQNKRGVSVNISGQRKTIPHAFLAAMPPRDARGRLQGPGRRGVYIRSAKGYSQKSIEYTPGGRLPIVRMVSLSQGTMFANPLVIDKTLQRVGDMFPPRMEHELRFILSGLAKR